MRRTIEMAALAAFLFWSFPSCIRRQPLATQGENGQKGRVSPTSSETAAKNFQSGKISMEGLEIQVSVRPIAVPAGGSGEIEISMVAKEGCHVGGEGDPLVIETEPPAGIKLDKSKVEVTEIGPDEKQSVRLRFEVSGEIGPGDKKISAIVRYSYCTEDTCYPPVSQRFEINVRIEAASPVSK
jgi:hypothetical protein